MNATKRAKLEALGYRVTDTQEFLGLSDEEMALIDMKIRLVAKLRRTRAERGLTQAQLAKLIQSSQSRIAMMERGRPEVSLDLVCRALFAMGVSRRQIGQTIASTRAA
jgi:DNA-binding XRE family transcriptional regulator